MTKDAYGKARFDTETNDKRTATLRAIGKSEEYVELNLRVRARVLRISDGHGPCVQLMLERRNYAKAGEDDSDPRVVWVDDDEIIEIQP